MNDATELTLEQKAAQFDAMRAQGRVTPADTGPSIFKRAWSGMKTPLASAWQVLGNPFIGLALLALLLFYGLGDVVVNSLWDSGVHYLGVLFIVAVGALFLVLFCYFLLDPWLSFKEFNKLVGRWWRGEPISDTDVRMGHAMAIRSGAVFLGLCILAHGGMHYWDFGAKVAEKAAGG